jgi:hypothetical protein
MTDDIVTRLRAEICECGYSESFKELHKCLNCEAADEIERLRTAYSALFHLANHAYGFNNFKVLQDNMKEHQQTARELGIYP